MANIRKALREDLMEISLSEMKEAGCKNYEIQYAKRKSRIRESLLQRVLKNYARP